MSAVKDVRYKEVSLLIDLQVISDRSFHLMLHDIMKLCPSAIYSEKILQRLFIHLKSPFCCPKTLISVLNLARVNNRGTLLGCFYQGITFLFLNTSGGCLD